MTLYLARLLADAAQLARLAHDAGLPEGDPGYLWHHALRQAFGAAAPQPFCLIEPDGVRCAGQAPLQLLGYTPLDAAGLRAAQATADGPAAAVFPASGIDAKALPESFAAGRRLAFAIRVCPIVRTASSDGSRKRELDVFVHEASAAPDAPKPDRETIYGAWLAGHLASRGAELHSARMTAFRLGGLVRRAHASPTGRTATAEGAPRRLLAQRPRSAARRPDATLEGILEVTDPARFHAMLAKGLGRHRAFGFGMLLLRRAG